MKKYILYSRVHRVSKGSCNFNELMTLKESGELILWLNRKLSIYFTRCTCKSDAIQYNTSPTRRR